jgi:hypothetical protein
MAELVNEYIDDDGRYTLKKSSDALPKGPSTMMRGKTLLTGGGTSSGTFVTRLSFEVVKSQPRDLARAIGGGVDSEGGTTIRRE